MTKKEYEVIGSLNMTDQISNEAYDQIMIVAEDEPEECGDCISRQAVLDTIGNVPDYDDGMVWEALSHAQRDVALLPSVSPQPKMGQWNFTKHYGRDYYVCSVCGMERMDDHSSGWNYCPNCGAKMQEVNNE